MTTQKTTLSRRLIGASNKGSAGWSPTAARFWDRIAKRYSAKPIANEPAYQNKLTVTRRYFTNTSTVLEIGCGTGSTAILHAPFVARLIATDFAANMLKIGREKAVNAGVRNVEFEQADAFEAIRRFKGVDVILGLNVLHLLRDWPQVIDAAATALAPGGALITSTPCLQDEHRWLKAIVPFGAAVGLLPKLAFFTREELRATIQGCGLAVDYESQVDARNGLFLVARKDR